MARRTSVFQRLRAALLSAPLPPDDADETGKDDTPPPGAAPGVDRTANAQHLREGMEKIRENLRTFGTAMGALATAVLAGLGWATFHQIFPVPAGKWWVWVSALVLAAASVIGSIYVTGRVFAAQRRIVFAPSQISPPASEEPRPKRFTRKRFSRWWLGNESGLTTRETAIVKRVLDEHAREEGAESARALETRALRLARIARRRDWIRGKTSNDEESPIHMEANRLDDVLATATLRSSLAVLERRSLNVFKGKATAGALLLVATGIIGLFFVADYSKGQRDLIALRDSCHKAVEAGAANACDPIDGPMVPSPTSTGDAISPSQTADLDLLERLEACASQVQNEIVASSITIPPALVERAVAICAGLSDQASATTPPTPTSPTP